MKNFTYKFIGTVYPPRVNFTLKGLPEFEIEFPDWKVSGKVNLEIIDCKITAIFNTSQRFSNDTEPNIETLKNLLERYIRFFVDAYCFAYSYNYDVDIEKVICEEDGFEYVFPVQGEWNISGDNQVVLKTIQAILISPILGIALSDFRRAIKYPEMTAMFCYRCMETIRREHFDDVSIKKGNDRDKDGWKKMSKTLGTIPNDIYEKMRDFATSNRHGTFPPITYDQREKMMNYTRDVINKFIDWKLNKS